VGWSRWLVVVLLAGCRLNFADVSTGDGGGDDDGDGGGDALLDGGGMFACTRAVPTTPTYWVDTINGNDANPGTQSSKVKTIQKAVSLAVGQGGTIIVAPGNYPEVVDVPTTQPLLLFSEERYGARIQRLACTNCIDLTVEGFEITGASLPLVSINNGLRVTIRDNAIFDGPSAGVRVTNGSTNIDVVNNVIYDTFASQVHVNVATNVLIRNNVVFYDAGATNSLPKIWLEDATSSVISGNVVFRSLGNDTSYGMISLRDTSGTTIVENNLVAGSPDATNVYASIGFDMATGTGMIRHNTFVGPMPGTAFGIGAGAVNTGSEFTLVNNLWASAGTTQPFTDGSAATTVTIRHNLYWNAPTGVFQTGGTPAPASDAERIVADPGMTFMLPAAPSRSGSGFVGGAATVCDVHTQLVEAMAKIAVTSPAAGVADPTQSPSADIRGRARPAAPAVGAYEP
jgi:hypothetical protein